MKQMAKFFGGLLILTVFVLAANAQAGFSKRDYFVTSEPRVKIHVREIVAGGAPKTRKLPLLLLHGGGGAGVASFDVPGHSLSESLAAVGYAVYLMDVRGYGESTKPADLDDSSLSARSSVTSANVARDIDAVINDIRNREKIAKVAVLGWASGGHWLGFYAAKHNEKISHLIMLNAIYGINAPWKLRAAFENKDQPGIFNQQAGAVRRVNAAGLLAAWTNAIPAEDKNTWRDPQAADFYAAATLASESSDRKTDPPTVRLPNGFQREAYEMSFGKKIFDAAAITAPTLVVRGDLDHWSRPEDLAALKKDLKNARRKKFVTIPGGTHFLFIDRPERGRDIFIKEIVGFLKN